MANFDIEAYLDGTLAPAERAAFEAEMASNPAFAQEVRLMQQLSDDLQVQLLRAHVTQALRDGGGNGKKGMRQWFGGLALLLLICAAGYFFLFPASPVPTSGETPPAQQPARLETPQQTNPGGPAAPPQNPDGNKPETPKRPMAINTPLPDPRYPAPPNIRGTGKADTALAALLDQVWYMDFPPPGTRFAAPFEEAVRLLQARDFVGAFVRLELIERAKPANDTLRFTKGYCLLELGRGKGALDYFEAMGDAGQWQAHRQWYRALGLLSDGRREEARAALKAVQADPRHPFRRQAEKALSLMK